MLLPSVSVEEVDPAHAADADAGDVEPIARRRLAASEHVTRNDGEARAGRADRPDEIAPGNAHGVLPRGRCYHGAATLAATA